MGEGGPASGWFPITGKGLGKGLPVGRGWALPLSPRAGGAIVHTALPHVLGWVSRSDIPL